MKNHRVNKLAVGKMVLGFMNLCVGTIGRIVRMTTVLLCLLKMKEYSGIFGFSNGKTYVRLIPCVPLTSACSTCQREKV
jgi:hypothetical protein